MSAKLNQAEIEIVNSFPEEMRAQATASILDRKEKNLVKVTKARNTFDCKVFDGEKLAVYGLGNRFPVTLRRKGWEAIIANIETIKTNVSKLPKSE